MRFQKRFAAIAAFSAMASISALAGASAQPAGTAPTVAEGQSVYTAFSCDGCHGFNGEGGLGPGFRANPMVGDATHVVTQIINGGGEMPGFGNLSDIQIAAVANYLRGSFGNAFPPITDADVATVRGGGTIATPAP